jgi:hypothetical protein
VPEYPYWDIPSSLEEATLVILILEGQIEQWELWADAVHKLYHSSGGENED